MSENSLSEFLKARREEIGKERKDIARETEFSDVYIQKLESGTKKVSLKSIYKIADAYETDARELIDLAVQELLDKVLER